MLSCKETVQILSSNQDLTFRQKLEIRAHLFMCKHCSAYAKQMRALTNQLKKTFKNLTRVETKRVREIEQKVIDDIKRSGSSGR